MTPFQCSNRAVFALAVAMVLWVASCARQQPPQCGGTRDDERETLLYDEGRDWVGAGMAPQRERYVEVPADPKEFEPNAARVVWKAPVTIQGVEVRAFFPTEQLVWHSIPFYVELPGEFDTFKAFLRYKVFGQANWKKLEMKKHGAGRVADIPCIENDVTGDLRYFIVVENADREPVGMIGSRVERLVVEVKNRLDGGQPAIEGRPLPTRCVPEQEVKGGTAQ